jgi:hypothetical protein
MLQHVAVSAHVEGKKLTTIKQLRSGASKPWRIVACITFLSLFASATSVRAELGPPFFPEKPAELVKAAFAAEYGQALVEQLGAVLTQSSDKACLASKGIDAAKMTARGREIYLRYGAQMLEMVQSFIKIEVLESKFAELAGPGAKAEMLRLQNDPDVKEFLAIARPAQLAHVAETISENLARFALIKRMRLLGPVNEFEVPNKELEDKNPTKGSDADAQRFMEKTKSAQLDRYLDLVVLFDAAKKEAFDRDLVLRNGGPVELFAGVDVDLADLCIPTQQPAPKNP